ncbi:MAG: DNA primase [Solirubrobacteraceae bacterium]
MARIGADSRERVRDAVDMVDLVSARTELRRAGASTLKGLCPFHEERTPSFQIDPVKKLYHCFGCAAGGDVFRFVMETEGLDFRGALEMLADRYGVTLEREDEDPAAAARRERRERLYSLLTRAADYYARFLWESSEAAPAREYLASRGLEEPTLREFRVGYAPSAWDHMYVRSRRAGFSDDELLGAGLAQRSQKSASLYDRFRARVMFPLCDLRGRVVGFGARALRENQLPKYLNSSEGELYHKGRQLFGADRARPAAARAAELLVVEGYTDVLALHQAQLTNAVGLMGTSMTEDQLAEAARLAPRVVLALDADAAGQEAMVRAARVAARRSLDLRVVGLPAGDDPADLVLGEGPDAMRRRLAESLPFARFEVERILAAADLSTGDGRDRALDRLRGVLGALPPSALREELVRLVAGRLALSEQLVASLAEPAGSAERAQPSRRRAQAPLDRRQETERTFLALCIALPEHGREALRRVDLEQHFTSESVRRAAAHLREHLAHPLAGLEPGDGDLSPLLAELSLRAAHQPAEPSTLEVQGLQLETARLEREIAAARAEGRLDISALARERTRVKERLDSAIDRVMETGSPSGDPLSPDAATTP